MSKPYIGVRLRSLRARHGLTQAAMAQALGLSPSYFNQLEKDQRPLSAAVLRQLQAVYGVDAAQFAGDGKARLATDLRAALAGVDGDVPEPELEHAAAQMPQLSRAILALHRRQQATQVQVEVMAAHLGGDRSVYAPPQAMPFELVRDFFFSNQNYFDAVDRTAEAQAAEADASGAPLLAWLAERLRARHGVRLVRSSDEADGKRCYDSAARTLSVAASLAPAQQAFQLATQLALLECDALLQPLIAAPMLAHDGAARQLARVGLANYFAGALLLPYARFLAAAESLRYDIDLLGQRFGVGFETVCHRLSTLQRPGAPGVPFFFVRVDRAGNISKRQSATHFHFSRTGGTCPLWNVYEAFAQPGRILAQLARMPDGRSYLWIARTVGNQQGGWGAPRQMFSIGLGCDLRHAPRLVYAKGLDLNDPGAATPIGMGCKVCERANCPQRAFPFAGRRLEVDENASRHSPYGSVPPRGVV